MTEVAQLAQEAIEALTPVLHGIEPLAGKALGGLATSAGSRLFTWLSERVIGTPAASSLEQARAEPENSLPLDILKLQIQDMAHRDPAFRNELTQLLNSFRLAPVNTQTTTTTGDNNKQAQAIGDRNTIRIS